MASSEAVASETAAEAQEVSSEGVESVHADSQERSCDDEAGSVAKRPAEDLDGIDTIQGGSRKAAKLAKPADAFVKCELCPRPARIVNRVPRTRNKRLSLRNLAVVCEEMLCH